MPNILRPKGPPPVVKLRDAIEKGSYGKRMINELSHEQQHQQQPVLDLNNSQTDYNSSTLGMETMRAKMSKTPGLTTRRALSQF